jgi:hypothetical protein
MIKIEFPADRRDIALAIGQALVSIGQGQAALDIVLPKTVSKGPNVAEAFAQASAPAADTADDEDTDDESGATELKPLAPNFDKKGVPFNPKFCATAKDPFYADGSGKISGQWKRRKGVAEDTYNKWYAEQLEQTDNNQGGDQAEDSPVNVGAAFGASTTQSNGVPKNTGELMKWMAEKQAAGVLTQEHINQAWTLTGMSAVTLFNTPADQLPGVINQIYTVLAQKAGA